jgi:uridine phosphorylase
MKEFKDSELVLNPDKSVYHLKLHADQIADNVIVVGDPGRVPMISAMFDKVDFTVQNREIVTHTGWYGGKHVTVMSTGMGPDNIDICLNELHVLATWDIKKGKLLEEPRKLNIVRIGTSGALQEEIPVESVVASVAAIGIDSVLNFYKRGLELINSPLAKEFTEFTKWPEILSRPYSVYGSEALLKKIGQNYFQGITITSPGFYGPQFRNLFIEPAFSELQDKITQFRYNNMYIANFEMETSALYGLGRLMGHEMLTVCLIIANRAAGQFSKDYKEKMKKLIEEVLHNLTS